MLLWVVLRNLRVRALGSLITVLGIALATATALVVPMVLRQLERGAAEATQVFNLLITAKGSPSQGVLSSLYMLQPPIANLPYSFYRQLANEPQTRQAIPLGLGDNYAGFAIVGTSTGYFEQRLKPADPPYFQLALGKVFAAEFEAVLGARTAQASGLKLGDSFKSEHGFFASREVEPTGQGHAETYTVVGVLKPTGGPIDRAILTPIETLWEAHGQLVPESRQVSAILYSGQRLADIYVTAQRINRGQEAQAIFPGQVFAQTRSFLLQGQAAYAALSLLVLLLAALLIGLSVYAGSLERLRQVALLRALGGGRRLVFSLVLCETLLMVGLGLVVGVLLGYGLGYFGGNLLGERLGFVLPAPRLEADLLLRVALLLPVGLLAALPPAVGASRQSPLEHV
jgi:putative ABC transport system permease protein